MTPEQRDHFRERLETQRQEYLDSRLAARESAQPVQLDQAGVGRLSRMDAMQGQAMAKEAQRRRDVQLQRIELALRRIDSGDYGFCNACEEEIALRRLESDPAATLCIACASRQEQQ